MNSTPLCKHHEIVDLVLQEWECNGRGFPDPIGDEIRYNSVKGECLEISYPNLPVSSRILVPSWFMELSRSSPKLSLEPFLTLIKTYETPEKVKGKGILKIVYHDWKLIIWSRDNRIDFWGFWMLGDVAVRLGTMDGGENIFLNVSIAGPSHPCWIVSSPMYEDSSLTLKELEDKLSRKK